MRRMDQSLAPVESLNASLLYLYDDVHRDYDASCVRYIRYLCHT